MASQIFKLLFVSLFLLFCVQGLTIQRKYHEGRNNLERKRPGPSQVLGDTHNRLKAQQVLGDTHNRLKAQQVLGDTHNRLKAQQVLGDSHK